MSINCDAIKIAYRQSKDGFVVSFAIHPQDMPAVLANADIGSQWQLTLVELDEHGNAEQEVMPDRKRSTTTDTRPAPATAQPTARAKQSWHDMSPANQAGVLCSDEAFWSFLTENYTCQIPITNSDAAAQLVREIFGVKSRTELPSVKWRSFVSDYRAWTHEPELVG